MKKLLILLAATVAFLGVVGCAGANDHEFKMTKDQIDALIAKELPVGTSREEVVRFLDTRKIDHTGHVVSVDATSIGAMFRDVAGSNAVVKKSVHVTFEFRDRHLVRYSLSEKFTGP